VGGDIVKELASVSHMVSQRPIDESLSLWLEVGTIKPVLKLYAAVADFISLQQLLSRTCVVISYHISYNITSEIDSAPITKRT